MNIVAALLASTFLASSSLAGPGDRLPNSCVITATEALARLSTVTKWVRVLEIKFLEPPETTGGIPTIEGHCLTVWQIGDKGPICVYDDHGTIILKTHSRELHAIIVEMNKLDPTEPILAAQFVE